VQGQKVPFYGMGAIFFTKRRGTILVREPKKAVSCRFWAVLSHFVQGAAGIWQARGPQGRNRSSGNGAKLVGFGSNFGIFEQKMRAGILTTKAPSHQDSKVFSKKLCAFACTVP